VLWIKLYVTLLSDRKVDELADELGIDDNTALGLMARLWLWAPANAPDGVIERPRPSLIARALHWSGDPGRLLEALISARVLDEIEDGQVELHGWQERQEELLKALAEKAERDRLRAEKARVRAQANRDKRKAEKARAADRSQIVRERDANDVRTVREPFANVRTHEEEEEDKKETHPPTYGGAPPLAAAVPEQRALMPALEMPPPAAVSVRGEVVLEAPAPRKGRRRDRGGGSAGQRPQSPEFVAFWGVYPRLDNELGAWNAFQFVVGHGLATPAELVTAAGNYAARLRRENVKERRFKMLATTFLGRDQRWRDDLGGRQERPPSLADDVATFQADRASRSGGIDAAVRLFEAADAARAVAQ